ncbi:BTB/POZ and MATH domain-containing protein 2-like [Panicum virgatum]|uniref:BTB/POZ and MATH domain-containing protein 2-like n=1 Tax=Panicum virgatum TaxID=38727 RepID=UPI0019D54398|nr:BTB/POZ and MATH domain-containing protein 2-like [Panicum virgatum]
MSTNMIDSCSFTHQFKLNFEETKHVAIDHVVCSGDISAGGHLWRIECFPRGRRKKKDEAEHLSLFLNHLSEADDALAVFEAFVMVDDRDGASSSSSHRKRCAHIYTPKGSSKSDRGWPLFVERSVLGSLCLTDGSFVITCVVKILRLALDDVPPSDIRSQLGALLDSADGSDVSFAVGGEEFPAHRAVLAARSPVFKAQLLGSMADAKMASIVLHDIAPATFKLMLRFIYTDTFPADGLLTTATENLRDLLAAADRYALDRLKLLCARKLWDVVSTETIATILACAETYNCPELRKKCVNFFADEKNFKKAVLTDGFVQLVQKFPSVLGELRVKVVGA